MEMQASSEGKTGGDRNLLLWPQDLCLSTMTFPGLMGVMLSSAYYLLCVCWSECVSDG